ncbi:MAG: helix-hairpin-helix domain-containing protein [Eubacteriales bacterium]
MKKRTLFEKTTLVATVVFTFGVMGYFYLKNQPTEPWEITMENPAEPEVTTLEEETKPDSLLEGEHININTAQAEDLERLPNIGATRAEQIVAYRNKNGAFITEEDLMGISGIGEVTLENLRPYITLS